MFICVFNIAVYFLACQVVHDNLTFYIISCHQEIICDTNGSMSVFLQDKSMFALLGQCAACPSSNDQLLRVDREDGFVKNSFLDGTACALDRQNMPKEIKGERSCGCHEVDCLLEKHRQATIGSSHWIQMVYNCHKNHGRKAQWIPKLHHIHWNEKVVSRCDVHVCKSCLLHLCDSAFCFISQ